MNAKTGVILAAGGFLLYRAANKAWGLTRLNYFMEKPSGRWDGGSIIIYLPIAIQNVSSASYTIRGFTGTLYANGYEISNISTFQLQVIKPHAQSRFTIAARLFWIPVIQDIANILFGGGGLSQELKLTGTVNLEGVPVPVGPLTYKLL